MLVETTELAGEVKVLHLLRVLVLLPRVLVLLPLLWKVRTWVFQVGE